VPSRKLHSALSAVLGLAALLSAGPVLATDVDRIPIVDAPEGTPALGAGLRLSGAQFAGDDVDVDLVPLYLYEGRWLFAHGTEFGAHLFRNENISVQALARYRFTRLDAEDSEFFAGLEDRRQTVDGGVAVEFRGGWGELQADWVTDMLDRHNGEEINLTYRYRWDVGNWMISPFVTLAFQDDDLTGYYYGVAAEDAAPGRPAYTPGNARNFTYGFNAWYQLTEHVFLFGNGSLQTFDSTIQNSPLVEEDLVATAFVGAGYLFGPVRRSTRVPTERSGEWSWRLNAGYAAKENIFPYLMAGQWTRSDKANTDIAGLTVGRLLMGGPRVDFYGKLALFRHFEGDFQDDFWNYTAYIMAVGKGYLPWSDKLAFRYGFGFGASYAETVPAVEKIKQAERDRNTSHFLNYLEFMADVPLARFTKAKAVKNCFAGVTVVHRSGIFASSDILGEVSGGSDWVTLHLECLR
jgi:outer membrane scaffolding protein for murein synthesis (MipA/OmpV family)